MNEKMKKESENWKSETARMERKERLAKLNDQSGHKKPIKEKGKGMRVVSILLVIAILLGFLAWFGVSMGYRQRLTKAFTISYDENSTAETKAKEEPSDPGTAGTETSEATEANTQESGTDSAETTVTKKELKGEVIGTASVAEANIYLGLMSQQFLQGGAFSQSGQDILSKPSQFNPNGTMREDFLMSVENQIKTGTYFYWKAQQEGYQLDETDEANMDAIISQYTSIAEQSQVTLNHYLSIMFGPGVNEKVFRDFFAKNQLGNKYYNDVYKGFTYEDAEINAKYDEDPDAFDYVDYRSYLFDGKAQVDPNQPATDGEGKNQEPDLEKAKADAEAFAAKIKDEDSFKTEVNAIRIKENAGSDQEVDTTQDTSLSEKVKKQNLSAKLADWLFAEDRAEGDLEVIEDYNGYRVVMFLKKYKPTNIGTFTTRHILFKTDAEDPEKSDAKMKAKAEEVLAEYKAGEQNEESFAALADKYTEDLGSAGKGGLYENTPLGQFVPEYEAFAVDPARQKGDVEIVKTTHGYHIIYFVSSEEEWKTMVINTLRTADEQAFMADVYAKTDIRQEKGIKLFGRP